VGDAAERDYGRLVMAAEPKPFWLDRADRRSGRRNLWLRALDAAGMGFDS
jgi:hypothetical protein